MTMMMCVCVCHTVCSVQTQVGVLTTLSFLIAFCAGSVVLLFVVERAKKCLDHAVTVFCVHLLLTLTRGSGFPAKPEWWMMEVVGVASMAVLGEWLCIQKELRETSIGSLGQIVRQQRYV